MAGRNTVNEIITNKLYQRAQILTWQRDVKFQFLEENKISIIVNFWPKIDPDLNDKPVEIYMHVPAMQSELMLEPYMSYTANFVAELLMKTEKRALILCEAGVTRSVYFTTLVVGHFRKCSWTEAYEYVKSKLPKMRLKKFMLENLGVS